MTQLSSTASTCATQWKMWLIKVFSVIYFTAVCAAEEAQYVTSMAEDVTATIPQTIDVPPTPSLQRLSAWSDVFISEKVNFSCNIAGSSDWTFIWNRNGVIVQKSDPNVSIKGSELTITAATKTYAGNYSCKGEHKTKSVTTEESKSLGLTVNDLPKPSLKLQTRWQDVYENEFVEFSCQVDSSDWTVIWYRNGVQVGSDPNVSLSGEGSVLTITAATTTHSGSYSCKGQHKTRGVTTDDSNSLQIKVNGNKPKPTVIRSSNFDKMFPGESITFSCTVDGSSGWEYLWYHNGNEIQAYNSSAYKIVSISHPNSGQYHCKAKRGKGPFFTEESITTTLQVSDPPTPSLNLQTPWPDVFENEIVELSCEVESSDWTVTWYRNQEQLQEDSVLTLTLNPDLKQSLLNITSVSQTYQGGYACKAHLEARKVNSGFSNTINVKVYGNTPTPTLSKDPGFNSMYVGETVYFTCKVDVASGWEYQWYKDGNVHRDPSLTINETISIHLDPSHEGNYSCKATRSKMTSTELSEKIPQDVLEIPVPSLENITKWLDVFPDESAKLSCGMDDSSGWTYTWSKDGQKVQTDNAVSIDANGAILYIKSASAEHEGEYNCEGHLNDRSVRSSISSGLYLTVYEEKPSVELTQDPDYSVMFPGESVSFSCHINGSSGWTYFWYKNGQSLGVSEDTYTISSVGTTNSGTYKCQAKRGTILVFSTFFSQAISLEVKENKPKPSMTQKPNVEKVYTGESVSFECKIELSSGWEYLWYKDGVQLTINSSSFNIYDANLAHSGTYTCMAVRKKKIYSTELSDGRTLHISEIPVPSLKNITQWLDVFPTESVKLRCQMDGSSDWKYTWYRDGQKVQAENSASFDKDRTTLSISSASALHRGQYNCSANLTSRTVSSKSSSGLKLSVYDTKPKVKLMQNPKHDVMHTGDPVSFTCHINVSSGWEYLWYKDSSLLHELGNNHTITSVMTANSGSYSCQTKRRNAAFLSDQSEAVTLKIEERPQADIILLTGWSEVFSTDSLVLRCGVQEIQGWKWNYTWSKEGIPINQSLTEKYIVTPQNNPEQTWYTCKGIRTGRPSYSKSSESFKTKNLLLKRRVLLSISGCIFFGIIAVLLGCVVLRFCRKPVDDEDKPEEANLFLTMAQLKDRSDAPCPLVEYITDAALNAPPKEGDENGTICSETTPLPITPQEDQAVTTESQDTTENNGALVSFKQ